MEDTKKLITNLIPPRGYPHRNGFTNYHIVDSLSEDEKVKVEKELIEMLKGSDDWLIGETLSYMKSENSIPILKEKLEEAKESISKIEWAYCIYKIDNNKQMTNIAFEEFQKLEDDYELIRVFYRLIEFQNPRINEKIKSYQNHNEYLVAYNAKTALGIDTTGLINKERLKNGAPLIKKNKPWWKFW